MTNIYKIFNEINILTAKQNQIYEIIGSLGSKISQDVSNELYFKADILTHEIKYNKNKLKKLIEKL